MIWGFVGSYSDSFNRHSDGLQIARQQEDFDNLQHSLSGVETGQQARHGLVRDDIDPLTGKSKKEALEDAIRRTLEQLLADDEQYRIAHESLMDSLHQAAEVTQSALERVVSQLGDAYASMNELLSGAVKLPSGERVFKHEDGSVRNEDGEVIPAEIAASIEWTGNEPSYSDYQNAKNRIAELENAERELRGIETEIGGIRGDATNNDNPLTKDGLGSAQDKANALRERAEEIQRNVNTNSPTAPKTEISADEFQNETSKSELTQKPIINIGSNL